MRAVVTGGAGFIGSHLVDRLVEGGHEVMVIDNYVNGRFENIDHHGDKIQLREVSVEDESAQMWAVDFKPDVIFHLAALGSVPFSIKHPVSVFNVNVAGTARMLAAAHKVEARFVFASSASYYGNDTTVSEFGPAAKVEEMQPRPLNHYGASKVMGELWGKAYARMHGLCFTALRFFNVFGPRQRDDTDIAAVVPRFVKAAMDGTSIELHNGGVQTRDMTFVDNVVDALMAVAEASRDAVRGESFNVCAGEPVTIADLAGEVMLHVYNETHEGGAILQPTPERKGDIRDSFGSYAKLSRAVGWMPRVRWQDGVKITVEAKRRERDGGAK